MTPLMNHEAVYRTAPATPGLLNFGIWLKIHFSGQRVIHLLPSTIIFPKMFCLACQFENLLLQGVPLKSPPLNFSKCQIVENMAES